MSFQILSQPGLLTPAYNENVWVVQPSGTNYLNAGYKIQITVKDTGGNTLATLQQPVHPNDSSGAANLLVFDGHRIIENYVSYNFAVNVYGVITNANGLFGYTCTFQEMWGAVLQGSAISSSARYVYNAALSWYNYAGYNAANSPCILDNTGGQFLTTPTAFDIQLNQSFSLYWLLASAPFNTFIIKTTSTTGIASTYTFTYTLTTQPQHARFTCGTYDLNQLGWGTIITPDIIGYTVQGFNNSTPVTPVITFNITQECRYDVFRVQFLNKYGGFDGYNFTKVNIESTQPTRKTYKQVYGSVTGGVWSYSAAERGDVTYDTRYKNKFHLTSTWLSDADMQWLLELIHSPVAYREASPGIIQPITIADAEYKINKKSFEPLYNLELDVAFGEDNVRQRG